jgi:deoxyribodipyrimidine photo-lyase
MSLPSSEKDRTRCDSEGYFWKPEAIESPVIPELVLPTLEELGLEFSKIDSRAAIQFKGGETEAMKD